MSRPSVSIFIVFVFLMTTASVAQAKCGLPREVQLLIDDLYASTLNSDQIDADLAYRLRRNSRTLDMSKVSSKLHSVGMSHRRDRIDALVKEAQLIDTSGHAMSPNILREKLKKAERLDAMVCKLEQIAKDKDRRRDALQEQQKKPTMPLKSLAEDLGTTARLMVLFSVASMAIGMAFALRYFYVWIHGRVNNRRACHISAAVECGLDVIDGYVTVLGRHGCRFQPVNEGAFARLEVLIGRRGTFVVCGSQRILVTLKSAQGRSAVALFHTVLPAEAYRRLLAMSQVMPQFVPKQAFRGKTSKQTARMV